MVRTLSKALPWGAR